MVLTESPDVMSPCVEADPGSGRRRIEAGRVSLEAEFVYAPLIAARNIGLDEEWLERLEDNDPVRRRALSITRLVAGSSSVAVDGPKRI